MLTCANCNRELPINANTAGDSIVCANCGKATSIPPGTVRTGENSSAKPQASHRQALIDSLSPAQGPDELGRLGDYRVLQILGVGGMGVVFRAEDTRLKRPVALKTMLPDLAVDDSARKRFLREAQAAASIKHSHIVTIHQVGEENGMPFLAMEFLEGESLEDRLNRGGDVPAIEASAATIIGKPPIVESTAGQPLPLAEILRIGREVAEGLAAAHERGLIHRDIKPLNIWLESALTVTPRASSLHAHPCAKILDFGLARIAAEKTQLTAKGDVLGTLAYMAPEQLVGGEVDHRCDLFSLGCTLYRMCTGKLPSALALKDPTPPHELNPAIPPALSDLVLQLLARDPADRPQTAHEVWERLVGLEQAASPANTNVRPAPVSSRPSASWAPPQPLAPKRQSLLPYIFVAVTVLIGIGVAIAFYQGLFTPAKRDDPNKNVVINVQPPPDIEPKKNGGITELPPPTPIVPVEPPNDQGSRIKPVVAAPVDPDHVYKKILERIRAENGSDKLRYLRFFSLHHLLVGGAGPEVMARNRQAFTQALQLLSRKKGPVAYEPIDDPDNTIFAVDIRRLGWDERPLTHATGKKDAAGKDVMEPADLNYFDLLLLDYPYGIWSEKSRAFTDLVDEFLVPAKQVRPIVYVRTDWLVNAAMTSPLGKELPLTPINDAHRASLDEALHDYWMPLTERTMAAELAVPVEDLHKASAELKLAEGDLSRETWESLCDRFIAKLGLGTPIIPVDGLGNRDWQRSPTVRVALTTNHPDNAFTKGDKAVIFVTNKSDRDVFIEVIATDIDGSKGVLTAKNKKLQSGEPFRYPEKGSREITDQKGRDLITVIASAAEFPGGDVLTGGGNVHDRVVHAFYRLRVEDATTVMDFDPRKIVKKTIEIVTK